MSASALWQHEDFSSFVATVDSERQQQSAQTQPGTARTAVETNDNTATNRRLLCLLLRIDIVIRDPLVTADHIRS